MSFHVIETKTAEVPRRSGSPVGRVGRRKFHYNWDGFTTFCGRRIEPTIKITSFNVHVTCKACLRSAGLIETPSVVQQKPNDG